MSDTGQDPDANPPTPPNASTPAEGEPAAATPAVDDESDGRAFAKDDTDEFLVNWAAFAASAALIDGTDVPPATRPPTASPRSAPKQRRTGSGRRLRGAVFSGAALAMLVAAGVGYAALNQTPSATDGLAPAAPAPTQPVDPDPTFSIGAAPGADPAEQAPPTSSAATTAAPTPGATATSGPGRPGTGSGGGTPTPVPTEKVGRPVTPLVTRPPASPRPPTSPPTTAPPTSWPPTTAPPTSWPPTTAPPTSWPPTTESPSDTANVFSMVGAAAWGLTATLDVDGDAATVWISNGGASDVDDWTVSFDVPNGKKVGEADGADVATSKGAVVFTPSGDGTVPAGETVSFSFRMNSSVAASLTNCTINGQPCA